MSYYHIWSIGCQMNKAYSEQLAIDLERLGYRSTGAIEEADIAVINSCVVRQSAENRVLSKLDSLIPLKRVNPDTVVALAGCMVDAGIAELRRRFSHVDLFLKPGESAELLDLARARAPEGMQDSTPLPLPPSAFVTIIEGCDNFCSYCIVPYRRGRERSRPLAEIRSQVEGLVERGVKQVTLLGQNVDSYGYDLPGMPDLADLLEELNSIEDLMRIRFLTSHPKDMNQKLIRAVASLDKVCESISLPVQTGDDEILQAMGRGYTAQDYRELVEQIRGNVPGVALSTDVIVGFPGETEVQFQRTLDLLSSIRFDTVHVAAYSPRSGTLASREFEDDVPPSEKKRRLQKVEELECQIASEINAQLLGQKVEVLVEGDKKGKWWGRTRTGKLVFFNDDSSRLGQLVAVEIEKTSPWSLQGVFEHKHSL
ncbi:MAG: tRNA (N6-isopentenyl adenosine(37)-C2)-methylthiotransferase MiaB [Dehalococcoidia bacterium]|nr:MAG: tRNA (N6-isopentenyl adenosine(37)-C2)-methylthiotransferase MiaB [Dehalococcoidia bacterium]